MQDVQLVSELLVLLLHGPQHRRDSLDQYYNLYRKPTGDAAKSLSAAAENLIDILLQLWQISDETALQAYHFPSACENDIYGLVGAFGRRGLLTKPQMHELRQELQTIVSSFRAQVEEYIAKVRSGDSPSPEEFDPLVEEYGRGFLGGQTNSKSRREDRIGVWTGIINGVVATLDPKSGFSGAQRRLIWARSAEKLCARCGRPVAWEDYHAGHKLAHAQGGRTVVDNGQVEHASCNLSAGAGL
jgi:hypothetical protein